MKRLKANTSIKNILILLILVTTNISIAQDFKALYSCSSGGEEKPITYAFNSKYMVRDGASDTPFEIVANFKDGELMYSAFVKGEKFNYFDELYGFTEYKMKKWALLFDVGLNITDPINTKKEFILRNALNCTLNKETNSISKNRKILGNSLSTIIERLKIEDTSDVDFRLAESCEKSIDYASSIGIKNIVEYYKVVNFSKIMKQDGGVRKSLVVINTKNGEIWESLIGSKVSPKTYKCSIISVDVPKILPPKEKMFTDAI